MSWAVGSFALALERVCALFLRPTERGRATEGEVGEAALLLLSLDCELPMPEVVPRLLARHQSLLPRGQQQQPSPSPSPRVVFRSLGRATVCAALSSSHGYKQLMPWLGRRMALGANVAGKGKGESQGRVISTVRRSCRQAVLSPITSTAVPRPSGGMRYVGGVRRARSLSLTLQDAETKRTPG